MLHVVLWVFASSCLFLAGQYPSGASMLHVVLWVFEIRSLFLASQYPSEFYVACCVKGLLKVLDPILWSNHNYSTPLQPIHRRHTFTTAAAVCLGCGLSLNITCETCNLHWALRVTCTIEIFVTPSSTHVVLFIH